MGDWDVHSWLQEIDYDKRYAQAFIDNGYDQPSLCANLKDEDLDAIEVDKEDRNRLFEHVERLRHHSFARVPISYSPVPNRHRSTVDANGHIGNGLPPLTKPSLDNFGASHEPSVKSPDSLGSVSHELPDHIPPSNVQLYSEALIQPSTHAPKKPPRSSKKTGKTVPPSLPSSSSSSVLSRLQLKLKLKEELQKDHILIAEPPYSLESGEPNEELLLQLAADYTEKFAVDSLEMYEAIFEFWRVQSNRSAQVTPMSGGDTTKLSPGQDKMTPAQKQPPAQPTAYMDPYNRPPAKLPRRPAPAVPHHRNGSEKGRVEKPDEKLESDLLVGSLNSSVNSLTTGSLTSAKSFHSMDSGPLSSPPSGSDIFLYEDVDGLPDTPSGNNPSCISSHSRESSSEKEHPSCGPQRTIVNSDSVPSFGNHVAPNKTSGKKRGGLKRFLTRNSRKKDTSLSSGDLMVNSVIEDDEDRASLTDRLKRQAPSDSVILTKKEAPSLPPWSSVMPLEKNGVPASGRLSKLLPTSKANIKRSQSTEAVDNISQSSSTSSSSEFDPTAATNHKQSPGMIVSALKFFKKKKDTSPKNSASNLTHSSSMPSIVVEEKLNELSKKEKKTVPPPLAVPSAYSEVFDRIIPPQQPSDGDPGIGQSSSLPRSGGASGTNSNSSSSCTLPSRGSPATSPGVTPKTTPPRHRQKQQKQQQVNGYVKKTSPLTKTKTDLTRIVQRQSSPEILMCTVSDAGVPIEWQNRDEGEQELQNDIMQDHVEQRKEDELQSDEEKSKLTVVKETEDTLLFEVHSSNTSDINVDATERTAQNAATTRPAVARRPKIPPKPTTLFAASKTDNATPKVTPRLKSLDVQTVLKAPVPKPRAKTPLSDDGRHSCSPVFEDELDSKLVPPAKPPRRRSAQLSSASDTPSPVASRGFFSATLPSTFAVEENREILSSPLPKPALPPKPKRTSSSTSIVGLESSSLVVVAENLNNDEIDLADIPYSTTWGECGIPVPLIERYAHELETTFDEMTQHLDQVRRHRLEQCQRVWVPMDKDYAVNNQNVDTSSLKAWTAAIGLPMYYPQLTKIGFRTVEAMKRFSPSTYDKLQFRLPLHSKLLQKAIQALYRN